MSEKCDGSGVIYRDVAGQDAESPCPGCANCQPPAGGEGLLPCPFCGGEPQLVQWRDTKEPNATWVNCKGCEIMTDSVHASTPEEAIRLVESIWNRRTAPTPEASRE